MPFGELGAVQNMSRDWVIDKFSINVDYQTDIEQARKIIKKIGQQLAEDPEYAPHIIEPMKMQGVENFGDFGIELRHQDDDQARRAIRHPPQGLRRHQEGVRGKRHQDTVPDRAWSGKGSWRRPPPRICNRNATKTRRRKQRRAEADGSADQADARTRSLLEACSYLRSLTTIAAKAIRPAPPIMMRDESVTTAPVLAIIQDSANGASAEVN